MADNQPPQPQMQSPPGQVASPTPSSPPAVGQTPQSPPQGQPQVQQQQQPQHEQYQHLEEQHDQQQQQQPGAQGKLFVGQVPAVCTEDMLRPVFQPYGDIVEIKIMRDAPGGRSKGCAWVKYATREQAQAAIDALHEQHTIPPQTNTLQVRFADDKSRTSGSTTAFVGNLPPGTAPETLKEFISTILPQSVEVKDVNVPNGKLFGFVTFESPQDCSTAVAHMQGHAPTLNGNQLRIQAARPRTSAGANNAAAAMAAYYANFGRMAMDPSAPFFMRGGFAPYYATAMGGYAQPQPSYGGYAQQGGSYNPGGRGRGGNGGNGGRGGYQNYGPNMASWNQGAMRQ